MLGFVGALLSAGYGALFALLDDFRDDYGISESSLGAVIGIGFLAGFVAQIALAPLADRGQARRLVLAGMALDIVGLLLLAVASSVLPMLAGRFVMGIGIGVSVPAIRRIVILADPHHLGQNLGRIFAADVAGFAAGPAVAAALSPLGLRAPFLFIAGATAVTIPFVARTPVAEAVTPATQHLAFDLLRERRFAGAVALGCALWLMIGAFDALWSVVLDDLHTAEWIATVGISLFALPIVIFGGVGGRLAQRIGPFRVGTVGLLLAAGFMAMYGLVPSGTAMFAVAMVHAVSDGLTASSAGVAVGMVAPAERQAGAQGVLGGMQTLVAGVTAIVAGALYDRTDRTTTYLVVAALMVVVVVAGALLSRHAFGLRAADVPEVVHGVVDEVPGKCVHGELGAVTAATGPVPLIVADRPERVGQHPAGGD
jgi:MFS transporter, DHA1 family, tetracycline resistance protein